MPKTTKQVLTKTVCDFCGSSRSQKILTKKVKKSLKTYVFSIVKCASCGHYYLNPRPKKLVTSYEQDYEPVHLLQTFIDKTDTPRDRFVKKILIRFYHICWSESPKTLIEKLREQILLILLKNRLGGRKSNITPGEILDVGAGDGFFLWAIKPLSWDVYGVDINPIAVKNCRRFGIKAKLAESAKTGFRPNTFDVVRMHDLLEHTPSPRKTLAEAKRILKPGGLLVVKTPQFPSLFDRLFKENSYALEIPRHLHFFSKRKLMEYLKNSHFHPIKINRFSMGTNLLTLEQLNLVPSHLSIFVTLLLLTFEPVLNILGLGDSIEVYAEKKR